MPDSPRAQTTVGNLDARTLVAALKERREEIDQECAHPFRRDVEAEGGQRAHLACGMEVR